MSLTTAKANELTTAITDAFTEIGYTSDTAMPKSKKNMDHLAWEVLVAKRLAKEAAAREAKAIRAAIQGGVMFDHKKTPDDAETTRVVYAGDVVNIDLAVGTGRAGIDHDAYVAGLVKARVDQKLLDRLAVNCVTTTAAPHSFTASLITK